MTHGGHLPDHACVAVAARLGIAPASVRRSYNRQVARDLIWFATIDISGEEILDLAGLGNDRSVWRAFSGYSRMVRAAGRQVPFAVFIDRVRTHALVAPEIMRLVQSSGRQFACLDCARDLKAQRVAWWVGGGRSASVRARALAATVGTTRAPRRRRAA